MSCSESSGGARLAYETLFNESPGRQYRSEEIHVEDEHKEDFIVSYFDLESNGGSKLLFLLEKNRMKSKKMIKSRNLKSILIII